MLVPGLGIGLVRAGPIEGDGVLANWPYKYAISKDDDGSYAVTHEYARSSATDVNAAADAMNRTARQLALEGKPFLGTLVFTRPLPVEEFQTFTRKYGMAPTQNIVRGVDVNGQGVKIGIAPVWARDAQGRLKIGQAGLISDPFDKDALKRMTEGAHPIHVVGVISTDVVLDETTYLKIRNDTSVFAVDVMEQVLTNIVQQRYPCVPKNKIKVWSSLLYPAMERTGLAPKSTP